MLALLAVRAIDLAIFGTLGGLWVGGAAFIYVLYRWILRYEAAGPDVTADAYVDPSSVVIASRPSHQPRQAQTDASPLRA